MATRNPPENIGELHPGICCDGCDEAIRGVRFKCFTCPDYDLCAVCEHAGFHQEHDIIEITSPDPQPMDASNEESEDSDEVHPGIWCDSCGVNIRGVRNKCTVCPDYDLCSNCKGRGFHSEHDMLYISSPVTLPETLQGPVHPGICCDRCDVNIHGTRQKCRVCQDYDLCSQCHGRGFHQEHTMVQIDKPISKPPHTLKFLHKGIWCDGCEVNIRGLRYKCQTCPDYDLCFNCESKAFHREHDMMQIFKPEHESKARGLQGVVHPGIWCDGCERNIRGIRHRCTICEDYDLCSECEAKGFHNEHVKVAISKPLSHRQNMTFTEPQGELHPGIMCDGCGGNVRGLRFKCRICPDYDLCTTCQNDGLHIEHTKIKIEKPRTTHGVPRNVLHFGVRCNACDGSIRGTRYKCRTCPAYDLCPSCKGKGIHKSHHLVEVKAIPLPIPSIVEAFHQPAQAVLAQASPGHGSGATGSASQTSSPTGQDTETQGSDEVGDNDDPMTCGICLERKKESFLIPCGHTLCTVCAVAMENTDHRLCPFCRKEIMSVGKIYL